MNSVSLMDALVISTFRIMGVLTRIGAEQDQSLTQLRVLGILRDRRARVTELAAFLGLDKSTMSGLIDRAERRGLLARQRNPRDGRVVEVVITPAGRELDDRLRAQVQQELAPMISHLAAEQQEQLAALLEAMLSPGPGSGEYGALNRPGS